MAYYIIIVWHIVSLLYGILYHYCMAYYPSLFQFITNIYWTFIHFQREDNSVTVPAAKWKRLAGVEGGSCGINSRWPHF